MSTVEGPLLWEGIWMIIRNGGCRCDPPGCGMEFCTGHCYLRADLEAVRALAYLPCAWGHCVGECRCQIDAGEPSTYKVAYEQSRATEAELRAEVVTWGQIWDDADMLEARLEALRDGTADLGDAQEPRT